MKNILLIAATGTISINPNLGAIVRLLCDNSFHVDIVSLQKNCQQNWNYQNSSLIICNNGSLESNIHLFAQLKMEYHLVIGVDESIIAASFISNKMKIPLGFISYEILFADEAGSDYKSIEIEACKNVSFAIAQDKVRAYLVSKEYGIPIEKILRIPVSDEYVMDIPNKDILRKHFKIPQSKKIALFSGAVTKRSMIDDLLDAVKNWDDNWVLVFHSYAGFSRPVIKQLSRKYDTSKIYISNLIINTTDELVDVIASADLGIGFFTPSRTSIFEGKNMLFMGLSSGKLAMYLKGGIPVMINEVGEMSDLVRKYKLGLVVNSKSEINPAFLNNMDIAELKNRIKNVYLEYFDFNRYANKILNVVENSMANKDHNPSQSIFNADYMQDINVGQINQLIYWFNCAYNRSLIHIYNKSKIVIKIMIGYKSHPIRLNDNLIEYYRLISKLS